MTPSPTLKHRLLHSVAGFLLAGLVAVTGALAWPAKADDQSNRWWDSGRETRKTRGVDLKPFYKDRERGWHFYEDDPEEAQRQDPRRTTLGQTAQQGQQDPPPLSVAWLREKLEETRIAAIDNPTRENIELYLYLQKIAMDKAEKFALMSQQVAMINPDLDESYDNPTTTFARKARMNAQGAEKERVLRDLAQKGIGIYYFFKSDCPYCAKQNMTLSWVARTYGFTVLAVSVDHQPFPDGSFPDWQPDRGQAKYLGISVTPTLYVFHPPNEVAFLAAGLQTEEQLIKRLLQVSEANGWLSREDLERALRGLPRDFLVDAVHDLGVIDWTNRDEVLEALRYATKRGVERARLDDARVESVSASPLGTPVE